MNDIFKQNDSSRYNLRQIFEFSRHLVKSVYHGSESVSFLGPIIWDMLPDDYRDIDNLNLKIRLKNGNLKIVLVDCVMLTLII